MFNVRLAGNRLCGRWLFALLSLVMSLVVSYCVVSFFPRDVLDGILGLNVDSFLQFSYLLRVVDRCDRTG